MYAVLPGARQLQFQLSPTVHDDKLGVISHAAQVGVTVLCFGYKCCSQAHALKSGPRLPQNAVRPCQLSSGHTRVRGMG